MKKKKQKQGVELVKPENRYICTRFNFYDNEEKYLIYLGYVKVKKNKYSVYLDKDNKDIYIYKTKAKRKRNRLHYIENEAEFHEVEKEVFSILGC